MTVSLTSVYKLLAEQNYRGVIETAEPYFAQESGEQCDKLATALSRIVLRCYVKLSDAEGLDAFATKISGIVNCCCKDDVVPFELVWASYKLHKTDGIYEGLIPRFIEEYKYNLSDQLPAVQALYYQILSGSVVDAEISCDHAEAELTSKDTLVESIIGSNVALQRGFIKSQATKDRCEAVRSAFTSVADIIQNEKKELGKVAELTSNSVDGASNNIDDTEKEFNEIHGLMMNEFKFSDALERFEELARKSGHLNSALCAVIANEMQFCFDAKKFDSKVIKERLNKKKLAAKYSNNDWVYEQVTQMFGPEFVPEAEKEKFMEKCRRAAKTAVVCVGSRQFENMSLFTENIRNNRYSSQIIVDTEESGQTNEANFYICDQRYHSKLEMVSLIISKAVSRYYPSIEQVKSWKIKDFETCVLSYFKKCDKKVATYIGTHFQRRCLSNAGWDILSIALLRLGFIYSAYCYSYSTSNYSQTSLFLKGVIQLRHEDALKIFANTPASNVDEENENLRQSDEIIEVVNANTIHKHISIAKLQKRILRGKKELPAKWVKKAKKMINKKGHQGAVASKVEVSAIGERKPINKPANYGGRKGGSNKKRR